jgi:hypothetical protein
MESEIPARMNLFTVSFALTLVLEVNRLFIITLFGRSILLRFCTIIFGIPEWIGAHVMFLLLKWINKCQTSLLESEFLGL